MTTISAIKIIGIDDERPPQVRKEAYIDLFFKLSQKTPTDWCEDFNKLGHQIEPPFKIDKNKGLIVETWIRDMNLIPQHLEKIKLKITECNEQYLEKIRQKAIALAEKNASHPGEDSKQGQLDLIVATLNFE